jgi:hypothetical protein
LTNALQESTANVDEWKRQLQSYKEENQRLKNRYLDGEVAKGKFFNFFYHIHIYITVTSNLYN